MIEKIVETDEALLIKYLEGEDICADDLRSALRNATINRQLVPVLCGSAMRGKGIDPLLDAIICYLPSPLDVPAVEGTVPGTDTVEIREPLDSEPLSALAFKVVVDPYVGRLVFLRIYSGTVESGAAVRNVTRGNRERMGRLLRMHANHREELAGDHRRQHLRRGRVEGHLHRRHHLHRPQGGLILEPPHFPEPVVSVAIEPATRADQDKLGEAMRKLSEEDPTFVVRFNDETGQTVISGMGELHLEVLVDRMRREFDVEARVGQPRVAYREAITKPVRIEGRFVRQTGGHGQYGHVWLELEPQERGSWHTSLSMESPAGVIPRNYIPAVEAGVKQALDNGPLAGYPLVDLKVTLVDGSYHTVDSSEMAFRSAAMMAMRDGTRRAAPVLQEPFFEMEIVTPGEFLSEVLSDLGGRRAQIRSIEGLDDLQTVSAMIPLGETFAYTTALRSLTRGRASYTMEFRHYEPVPESVARTLAYSR